MPVICSALHSTGLPDHVEFSNRLLAPLTDAFIAVAEPHGRYLAAHEGCPAEKIRVIPNGVDVERFHPRWPNPALAARVGTWTRRRRWWASWRRCGRRRTTRCSSTWRRWFIEKLPAARFLMVGDGPQRTKLEALAQSLGIAEAVRFLGTRCDVPEVLSLCGRCCC